MSRITGKDTKPELLLKAVATDAEGKMRNGGLSRQQRLRLRRAFGAFDADGSGAISYAELQAAFRQSRIVVPDAHLRRMFEEADADRSGEICDFNTWRQRGWCRMEFVSSRLCCANDIQCLVISSRERTPEYFNLCDTDKLRPGYGRASAITLRAARADLAAAAAQSARRASHRIDAR